MCFLTIWIISVNCIIIQTSNIFPTFYNVTSPLHQPIKTFRFKILIGWCKHFPLPLIIVWMENSYKYSIFARFSPWDPCITLCLYSSSVRLWNYWNISLRIHWFKTRIASLLWNIQYTIFGMIQGKIFWYYYNRFFFLLAWSFSFHQPVSPSMLNILGSEEVSL